jgi:hypothetical protein
MRHANIATTMNVYTKALTPAKREAQSRVVDLLVDRSRDGEDNMPLQAQRKNGRIKNVSRFR